MYIEEEVYIEGHKVKQYFFLLIISIMPKQLKLIDNPLGYLTDHINVSEV